MRTNTLAPHIPTTARGTYPWLVAQGIHVRVGSRCKDAFITFHVWKTDYCTSRIALCSAWLSGEFSTPLSGAHLDFDVIWPLSASALLEETLRTNVRDSAAPTGEHIQMAPRLVLFSSVHRG